MPQRQFSLAVRKTSKRNPTLLTSLPPKEHFLFYCLSRGDVIFSSRIPLRLTTKMPHMTRSLSLLGFILTAIVLHAGLQLLPDTWALPCFCRVPATCSAIWFQTTLNTETLTYIVDGISFEMARSCSGEGFFSIAFSLLLWRKPKWCWAALPLTLILNTLRAILTATLTLFLHGNRFESIVHLIAGASIFITTLYLLWFLTGTSRHDTHD